MNLRHLNEGDIVEANVRGVTFTARAIAQEGNRLWVEPLTPNISYRLLRPQQVLRLLSSGVELGGNGLATPGAVKHGKEGTADHPPAAPASLCDAAQLDAGRLFPIHQPRQRGVPNERHHLQAG